MRTALQLESSPKNLKANHIFFSFFHFSLFILLITNLDFRTDILSHRDRLYRLALSLLENSAEAEDVVQDVMLKAWERREEWDTVERPLAWLSQMTKNQALDKLRKMHPDPLPQEGSPQWQHPNLVASPQAADGLSLLQRLIAELPPPMDDLVRLRDIEGMSYREIAQHLQLSEAQVRVYLHRARNRIKERYMKLNHFGLS